MSGGGEGGGGVVVRGAGGGEYEPPDCEKIHFIAYPERAMADIEASTRGQCELSLLETPDGTRVAMLDASGRLAGIVTQNTLTLIQCLEAGTPLISVTSEDQTTVRVANSVTLTGRIELDSNATSSGALGLRLDASGLAHEPSWADSVIVETGMHVSRSSLGYCELRALVRSGRARSVKVEAGSTSLQIAQT